MDFITIRKTAEKWGVSSRWVQVLCAEGRIEGAARIGNMWVIPKDAERPKDARIKSGKYVKSRAAINAEI